MIRVKWKKRRIDNDGNITESKKYRCVCTCCHRNDLPWYNCVIFVKHNYNLNIPAVANALSERYREIRQKEFICKSCHKELKDGKYSKNVQKCPNSDKFGSNVSNDQNNQHNVQEKRIHYENNIISDFPANYTSQSTTLTNYCLCTCCHKTDIPRSNRFSVPTSKEYICKKYDKDLLEEIMPMNSVASQIQLTSNEPQQRCIHCNTLCTEKFLIFNKAKYGQNTIVSQVIENNTQNIICNKCHNVICREYIYMNIFIYTAETVWDKKTNKNAWSGMWKWSTIAWHPTRSTENTAIGEKSDFSTNPIHNNTCHEMIWWPLQSKWSICQCSSNTR